MFELQKPDVLLRVAQVLEASDTLVLTCHVRPDGDAIGSMLGLGLALEAAGRNVIYYTRDIPAENLRFLPGTEKLVHLPPEPFPAGACLVVLDCSETDRIGEHGAYFLDHAERVVVIDHHLGQDMCGSLDSGTGINDGFCVQYINPEIFATGAICFALLERLEWPVSPEIATNFYAAILTDTGCFRHSNTTVLAFSMAARLVEYGADPYRISDNLFERLPVRKIELLGRALETISVDLDGMVAMLMVTPAMLQDTGASVQDADDFVCYARCIDGVEVSAFIKEVVPGQVSVSLRSRTWFNVAEAAEIFGGGGHFHAAGFHQPGTAGYWRQRLLDLLRPQFQNNFQEVSNNA